MKRAVRLAPVVRAIAVQGLLRFRRNAAAEEFAAYLANVHIGDLPVVIVDIYRKRSHCRASGWSKKERKVLRRSTWRLAAQLSMPHRSPRRITESVARVTAVYSRLRWCMKECDLWAITTAQGNSDPCTLWIDVAYANWILPSASLPLLISTRRPSKSMERLPSGVASTTTPIAPFMTPNS